MKKHFYLLAVLFLTALSATAQENDLHPFWVDTIVSQPDGYVMDADGNVEISSSDGLVWLISAVNGLNGCEPDDFDGRTVRLTDDIDFGDKGMEYRLTPIGTRDTPFKGTFDGNGHKIQRILLYYTLNNNIDNNYFDIGVFGYIRHAIVQNVTLDSTCRISSGCNNPDYYRGCFVGFSDSLSVVENCHINTYFSEFVFSYGGTLVGMNRNSIVRNCMCGGNNQKNHFGLRVEGAGLVKHNRSEGGYADAVVENCYFHGRLDESYSSSHIGGLVCFNETEPNDNGKRAIIRNCHSTPIYYFLAYRAFGTIAAVNGEGSLIENCYSDLTKMYQYNRMVGKKEGEIIDCIGYNNSTGQAVLDRPVAIGETETDILIDALNLWIAEQEQPERYRTWAVINDSVPEFAGYYIGIPESDMNAPEVTLSPNPATNLVTIIGVEAASPKFSTFSDNWSRPCPAPTKSTWKTNRKAFT